MIENTTQKIAAKSPQTEKEFMTNLLADTMNLSDADKTS